MPAAILRTDLNETLEVIAASLDLDDTRYQNAEEKYKAIGRWLDAEDSSLAAYKSTIYPQGSFILGTTVKPISSNEDYDIDLVCKLSGISETPKDIKKLVGARLQEHEGYRKRLEEKNRCWRINYAGEFHLDILPAIPSLTGSGTAIRVSDKELRNWKESDPKGYAIWFRSRMADQFTMIQKSLAELEQKRIEEIPEFRVKTALQRAIQLMKRNRDIAFFNNADEKPISIIITTLAGLSYRNQDDLFDTLISLVNEMPNHIQYLGNVAWVRNPVNHKENFADKWQLHPERKTAFLDWIENLDRELARIEMYGSISDAEALLANLFGEQVTKSAITKLNKMKRANVMSVSKKKPPVIAIQNPNKPWRVNGD